jgi:hypothetical protein
MAEMPSESERSHPPWRAILLGYLQAAGCPRWPGADGQTLDEVLHNYAHAASAGSVPNLAQLLEEYPGLAADFRAFFAHRGN